MHNALHVPVGNQARKVPAQLQLEDWMDEKYEARLRIEAARTGLPLWTLRRLGIIFDDSPYLEIPRGELPVEHFGNVQ